MIHPVLATVNVSRRLRCRLLPLPFKVALGEQLGDVDFVVGVEKKSGQVPDKTILQDQRMTFLPILSCPICWYRVRLKVAIAILPPRATEGCKAIAEEQSLLVCAELCANILRNRTFPVRQGTFACRRSGLLGRGGGNSGRAGFAGRRNNTPLLLLSTPS